MKAVKMNHMIAGKYVKLLFRDGFGFLDERTGEFASWDGNVPYVLRTKKLAQACIMEGWPEDLRRVRLDPINA